MNVTPEPTGEEAAAIAAAIHLVALRPVVVAAQDDVDLSPTWRFSGRWWSRPVAVRRFRPWT